MKTQYVDKKTMHQFLDLAFDTDNAYSKEILAKMANLDAKTISIKDYAARCLTEIATNKAEALFIIFVVGTVYGQFKAQGQEVGN